MLSEEAVNINFIVCGLIRAGFEPMIYQTQGEHANPLAADVVILFYYRYSREHVKYISTKQKQIEICFKQ